MNTMIYGGNPMWVKTTCRNSSLSSFNKKLLFTIVLVQYYTSTQASTCRRLQPSQLLYQPIHLLVCRRRPTEGSNLHSFSSCSWKGATTPWLLYWPICLLVSRCWPTELYNLPGTTFHKFSDQIHKYKTITTAIQSSTTLASSISESPNTE